jgi:hypothetical protein
VPGVPVITLRRHQFEYAAVKPKIALQVRIHLPPPCSLNCREILLRGASCRSYKTVDDRSLVLTNKRNGETTSTGRIVVSKNGKSRTVTTTNVYAKGESRVSVAVYDKK